MQTLIGEGISLRDCYDKAKEKGHHFIGFQNGKECWADSKIGKYPRVSEMECKVRCQNGSGNCGGDMRNAVYDIRNY